MTTNTILTDEEIMLLFKASDDGETDFARAIEQAVRAKVQPGWMPIETAPKHTEVLVWREDSGPFIAKLTDPSGAIPDDEIEQCSFPDDFEEWFSDAWGWQEGDLRPTHWQPLPADPSAQQAVSQDAEILGLVNRCNSFLVGILRTAREKVDQGWAKGAEARDGKGRKCSANCTNSAAAWSALGALRFGCVAVKHQVTSAPSLGESSEVDYVLNIAFLQAIGLISEAAGLSCGYGEYSVRQWNDAPGREKPEIIAVFDSLIDAARGRIEGES